MVKKILTLLPVMILVIYKQFTNIIFIMIMFNIIDYITGIIASVNSGVPFNGDVAIKGIFKKISYLMYVLVSVGVDVTIADYFKTDHTIFITGAVIVWLIGNEAMSILSNVTKVTNLKLPDVLKNALEKFFKGE